MVRVGDFRPSTHGFRFGNSWPRVPVVRVPTPFGPIAIGNAAGGMCGGIAFATRDCFEAGVAVPPDGVNPASDTALFRYLARRLVASFDLPFGVLRFLGGQVPPRDAGVALTVRHWPRIRAELDAGRLVCLGLIRVRSWNPARLGHNHQVLAYGYDVDDQRVVLAICDGNHHDRDDVTLSFSTAGAPDVRYAVGGVESERERTFGAFVQRYIHRVPRLG